MKTSLVTEELKRLAELHGTLQPAIVVDAARAEDSPLHNSFDWDDSDAANQWRLHQARNIINAAVVYQTRGDGKEIQVRAFVSLSTDRHKGGEGYRLTLDVMSDVEHRAQLLVDARAEMLAFKGKYAKLNELAAVFAAIDQAVETEALSATA